MALRTGYGTGAFTAGKYGLPQVYLGAVSASISSSVAVSAQRIHVGSATANILASAATSATRVQNGIIADNVLTSVAVAGYTTIVGASTATLTTTTALYWNRIRPFSASDSASVGTSVNSRYKWVNAQDPTTSWTQADYLERAA